MILRRSEVLSPSTEEAMQPGELTRISLEDVRDISTIRMPYGQDVPVVHLSSGMRRIIAQAYFLVWAWDEHQKAAEHLDGPIMKTGAMFSMFESR